MNAPPLVRYAVRIPDWSDGCFLDIFVLALTPYLARMRVVAWVNYRAGRLYCLDLPRGTTVRECPGDEPTF